NYVNVGKSLLEILNRLGITAFVPHLQECCGAPAFFTGDIKSVVHLAKKNITYFESFWEEIDAMVIPEATCAAMIKKDWLHALSDEPEWAERLEKLLPKIDMASSWLFHHTPLQEILPQNFSTQNITYHDPCHARKVLGIHKEPRALLKQSFILKEMSDSTQCCGFGGVSMQSSRYALTLKAGRTKADMIEKSGAEIVSAECGACRMQIDNALTQIDSKVRFAHPLELIAQAFRS
ncbi:(Fe-S)-binding protein, partial [uncultured Helicobacter sp.]